MSQLISLLLLTLVVGSVYSMAAVGLVVTYRTSRVFNFAHGAVGMFFAYLFRELWVERHIPLPIALLLVVGVAAPAAGIALERAMFRPLRTAPTVVKAVVTVGLLVALQGLASTIWGAPGLFVPSLVPIRSFRIGSTVAIGSDQLVILAIAAGATALLAALLQRTTFGLRIRAVVDRPDLAELTGIRSGLVSGASWAIGFATAALGGILLSPLLGLSTFTLTLLVIQAYAAALIGRLESLPMTFLGGLVIAGLEQAATLYLPRTCNVCSAVRPSIPFLLMFGVLAAAALLPRSRVGSWVGAAVREEAAAPPPHPRTPAPARAYVFGAAVFAMIALSGPLLSDRWLLRVEGSVILVGVFSSLAVLSGLSGQISLGHTAFVGTGAFVMGGLTTGLHLPFPLALLLAGLAAVPVGILVALPAIRLQGLFLALLTFGYGLVASGLFASSLTHVTSGVEASRPSFAATDLGFLYVALLVTGLLLLAAANLEGSPSGRILAAIRDSEHAALSIGLELSRYKLAAFAMSAFMAGIAGALYGSFQTVVTFNDFNIFFSLIWLSVAVIGGVGSVWGAAVGGLVWLLGSLGSGSTGQILFGAGAMLLARNDRGVLGMLRDGIASLPRVRAIPRAAVGAYRGRREEVADAARGA